MYCVAAVLLFWPFLASWQIIEQTQIINWKATMMIIYIFSSVFTVCGRLMNFPVWVNIMFKDLPILQCLSLCRRKETVEVIKISLVIVCRGHFSHLLLLLVTSRLDQKTTCFLPFINAMPGKYYVTQMFLIIYPFLSETEGSSKVWAQQEN